ncbi:MAG: beta-ketoacyl-[acyl-carrier-protein] synthase family protein [Planctomycetota bacterium]
MNQDPQIVITGVGVVSPIGIGVDEFWQSLLHRRSGIKIRKDLADTDWPLKLYSPIEDFDGKQWVRPRKALKVMCRPIQFGYTAASLAVEDSRISESELDPDRLGTVFGSETFFAEPEEVASVFRQCTERQNYEHDRWGEFAMKEIQPLWMLKYLPNMVTSHISIAFDARGPSNSICQAEASSLLALHEGADLIRRGTCDAVIVGGTGSQTSLSGMLYRGHHDMSQNVKEPENACRPFDANRDGTVFGEGAGALVLESESHARRRQAKILGRVTGMCRNFCGIESGRFQSALEENLRSLTRSQNRDRKFTHFNAHGSAARDLDELEAQAISNVFGEIPVLACKSNFGHLGPGAGMIELIASILAMQHQTLPPSCNYCDADPLCPVDIGTAPRDLESGEFAKLSFSQNGQIASLSVASC